MGTKKTPEPIAQKELQNHLVTARVMLWDLIQHHPPKTIEQARAAVDAYKHVDSALELCQKQLSQLPLPEPTTGGDNHDGPAA